MIQIVILVDFFILSFYVVNFYVMLTTHSPDKSGTPPNRGEKFAPC